MMMIKTGKRLAKMVGAPLKIKITDRDFVVGCRLLLISLDIS